MDDPITGGDLQWNQQGQRKDANPSCGASLS